MRSERRPGRVEAGEPAGRLPGLPDDLRRQGPAAVGGEYLPSSQDLDQAREREARRAGHRADLRAGDAALASGGPTRACGRRSRTTFSTCPNRWATKTFDSRSTSTAEPSSDGLSCPALIWPSTTERSRGPRFRPLNWRILAQRPRKTE